MKTLGSARSALVATLVLAGLSGMGCAQASAEESASANDDLSLAPLPRPKPDFQGNPQIPEGYDGDVTATYFTLALDEATVKSMLPPGVVLGPQLVTSPGKHPVIFVHNTITRMEATGVPPFAYDEWLTLVPAAGVKNGTKCATAEGVAVDVGAVFFMPKLLLNEQLPVDVGVNFYGFNKHLTTVRASLDGWTVFDVGQSPESTPMYRTKFGAEEPMSTIGNVNGARLKAILPNAAIGQMRDSGALVWSGLEFRDTTFTALKGSSVDIDSSVFGRQHYDIPSLNDDVLGAYRLRGKFRGSMPALCTTAN